MSQKHAPDVRTVEYWAQRWTDGRTGWHQEDFDSDLVAQSSLLLPPPHSYRVFVPLCGRSLDLLWLYKGGHTVVGVEGVEEVVKQFFTEHSIPYTTSLVAWATLYKSEDGRMSIYVCDLFSVDVAALKTFDAVYDRGSLVAINVCDRQRYASLVKRLLRTPFRYLLSTVEYEPSETFAGPPCSISIKEVEALFGDVAVVSELSAREGEARGGPWAERALMLSSR